MGKTHSRPNSEREPLRAARQITFPVRLTCPSRPSLNRSFEASVVYHVDTVLLDVLKQIEAVLALQHSEPAVRISAVSGFLKQRIALSQSNKQRLRMLQYRSITSYAEKAIRSQGVHCELEMDSVPAAASSGRLPLRTIASPNTTSPGRGRGAACKSQSASKPLQTANPRRSRASVKAFQKRMASLTVSGDAAYGFYDEVLADLDQRDAVRVSSTSKIDGGVEGQSWGGLSWRLRGVLLDWFLDLEHDLGLHSETVLAAVHYLDLYLSRRTISRHSLQLLGVTCAMLASKTYEVIPQPMSEWLYLSHDQYSRREMVQQERQLLAAIQWAVFQATPCNYAQPWLHILSLSPHSKSAHSAPTITSSHRMITDFVLRAAALTAHYLRTPSRVVAAAAIALSFLYLRRPDDPQSGRPVDGGESAPFRRWTASEQAPQLELLAAASGLDLRGEAVRATMEVAHDRVCQMVAARHDEPCSLFKAFTDSVAVEKRYGPRCAHLLDDLDIRHTLRPLRL